MRAIVESIEAEFRRYKQLAEGALAQLTDSELDSTASDADNSVAVVVQHVGGNLRSRFTDFLTTDGEKPWRDRDREFEPRGAGPPAPLAQDVSRDETVTVAFTEPVNPATVGPASFLVTQALDTVPGAYAFGDSTVSFVPDAPLRAFTTYGARLSRGIRDPAGNQLARDTAWSFLTGSEADPAPPR